MSNVPNLTTQQRWQTTPGVDTLQIYSNGNVNGESNPIAWIDDAGKLQGAMFSTIVLPAQTPLTSVTSAQNLFSQSVPAGLLNNANKVISVFAAGVFTSTITSQSLTFALTLGGVSLVSITGTAQAVAITNGQFEVEFVVTTAATGTSGTLESHGTVGLQQSATLTTALPYFPDPNTAVSSAVNLTIANNLNLTIADTSSLTSITLRQAVIEFYN